MKLDTEKLFYKQMDPKMAVLYNDNEEVKIIQKLEQSEKTADLDLLVEFQRKVTFDKYMEVFFRR
jgi:hypothetical protein